MKLMIKIVAIISWCGFCQSFSEESIHIHSLEELAIRANAIERKRKVLNLSFYYLMILMNKTHKII